LTRPESLGSVRRVVDDGPAPPARRIAATASVFSDIVNNVFTITYIIYINYLLRGDRWRIA